jgi:hypothetical protein
MALMLPPSPPPHTHTLLPSQIAPIAVAVDGWLIVAVRGLADRVAPKLRASLAAGGPPLPTPRGGGGAASAAAVAAVVPWYIERLEVHATAVRVTFWSRGVLPEVRWVYVPQCVPACVCLFLCLFLCLCVCLCVRLCVSS